MPKARPAPGAMTRILRKLGLRKSARPVPKRGLDQRREGAVFQDVTIVPGTQDLQRTTIVNGGPIWPDFANQTWPRLMRNKRVVDTEPLPPKVSVPEFPGPAVWGGVIYPQFGHMICEHLTRLLWSRQKWPDLPYLFIAPEKYDRSNLPGYIWELIDWFGLPREQLHVITSPVIVPDLHVMPQAERLFGPRPTGEYLDLLETQVAKHHLQPIASDKLYVGRMGMIEAGSGANAGESYVAARMQAQGVELMDPTAFPLRQQMERVMGAKTLIFAEGSALHGRQLLGRLPQKIHVLNRRLDHDLGRTELGARSDGIEYYKVTRRLVSMAHHQGRDIHPRGLSFYDLPILFDALLQAGIDLTEGWDDVAYAKAVEKDARIWLSRLNPCLPYLNQAETLRMIRADFEAEGLGYLLSEIEAAA